MRPGDYGANMTPEHEVEVPLLVGSGATRRWFCVDSLGRLTSPFRPYFHYAPFGKDDDYYQCSCDAMFASLFLKQYPGLGHDFLGSCSCGFYSYYQEPEVLDLPATDQEDSEDHRDYFVGAVVENFGRMVYGDQGLRSEKMRIKALVTYDTDKPTWKSFFKSLWADKSFSLMMTMYGLIYIVMYGVIFLADPDQVAYGVTAGIFIALYLGLYSLRAWKFFHGKYYSECISLNKRRFRALKAKYPDLPVYSSWEAAEQDFPHTRRKDLP